MRLCLFPCLLGTLRDEGSEEEDVLKEMAAKDWKESPVRIAFSRMLGLILFSMFLKNAGCVATTVVRPSLHSYSNLPVAGEVMGKTVPEA